MFRAVAVLRVVVLLNAVALNIWRRNNFDHPALGVAAVVVMVAWTGFAVWAYAVRPRRVPTLLLVDLAIAAGLILASPLVKGEGMRATVPGFWVTGALIAWAIHWRWKGGLAAALALVAADVSVRDHLTQANYGNLFLLMIGGPIVGYLCESIQRMAAERDAAERAAAVAEERARLARAVHDGVLQVLSLVQRRGLEIGGEAAELARLAGDQEVALRSLIRQQDTLQTPAASSSDPTTDVAVELERIGAGRSLRLSVVTPGTPVPMPTEVATELLAVVGACLDNVTAHVGAAAPAWVLLEELGTDVVVSVRDDGPGIAQGRLDAAVAEGRLGVSESIRGRIRDLGGTAELVTGPGGTEWELTLPRS